MDGEGKNLVRVVLIDVFSEDDALLSYPAGSSPLVCRSPPECQAKWRTQGDQVPIPADSPEPALSSTRKYNLRKSLAWDSAFFTSEGVLDPEELANVNSGFKNVQTGLLPGIQEDTRRSADSNSTLDCDTRAGESAEVDFFANLETSVQKSQRKQDEDPSSIHASSTFSYGKIDVADSRRRIHDFANSGSMDDRDMEPSGMPMERVSNQPQTEKGTSENRQKKPSPRTTRAASRLTAEPSRGPLSSRSIQPKTKDELLLATSHVGKGQHVNAKEKPITGDFNNVTSRVTASVKVSDSSVKQIAIASGTSNTRSGGSGTSRDRMGKARPEDSRKNTCKKVEQPSSKSVDGCALRDSKGNCGVKNAKPTRRSSSSVSPRSSVESWASESSSSSTSTVKNPTNSPSALDPSSNDTLHDPGRAPKGERAGTRSSGIHSWSNSSTGGAARCQISGSEGNECKRSSLRLPSPKSGYFDSEKPRPQISNRYSLLITEVSKTPKTSLKCDAGQLNKSMIIPNSRHQ